MGTAKFPFIINPVPADTLNLAVSVFMVIKAPSVSPVIEVLVPIGA